MAAVAEEVAVDSGAVEGVVTAVGEKVLGEVGKAEIVGNSTEEDSKVNRVGMEIKESNSRSIDQKISFTGSMIDSKIEMVSLGMKWKFNRDSSPIRDKKLLKISGEYRRGFTSLSLLI